MSCACHDLVKQPTIAAAQPYKCVLFYSAGDTVMHGVCASTQGLRACVGHATRRQRGEGAARHGRGEGGGGGQGGGAGGQRAAEQGGGGGEGGRACVRGAVTSACSVEPQRSEAR